MIGDCFSHHLISIARIHRLLVILESWSESEAGTFLLSGISIFIQMLSQADNGPAVFFSMLPESRVGVHRYRVGDSGQQRQII